MKSISAEERSYPDRPNFSVYAKYFILCLQHIKNIHQNQKSTYAKKHTTDIFFNLFSVKQKTDSVQFYLAYVK